MSREVVVALFTLTAVFAFLVLLAVLVAVPGTRPWSLPTSIACVIMALGLNGHLRGRLKPQIDGVLVLVWLALIVAAFVAQGWRRALMYVVASVVLGLISPLLTRPLARMGLGR